MKTLINPVPAFPFAAPRSWLRVGLTLLLAYGAARLCVWLHTPIPWMMGPLVATSLVSVLGARTESWVPLRNLGQWVIGSALGLYFTPEVGQLILGWWWAIALGVVWALGLGLGFGAWLRHQHARAGTHLNPAQQRSTCYFASAIGGASEMTLMAERHGARTDLVAAAHSLRVLMVTLILPFVVQFWGIHGLDRLPDTLRLVQPGGLLVLAVLTLLGVGLMRRLGRANPWFMGGLLVSMVLSLSGVVLSALPGGLINAAQLVIGVSLGVRFTPAFVHAGPRWLASVALGSTVMMVLCAGFAWVLAHLTGAHWATLLLGTSPGGIAEMAITAKVLHLGVAMVTAFQVSRLVAVLVLAEPVFRWWQARHPVSA